MKHAIQEFVHNYSWIHTGLGIFGGIVFFIGSIMFLSSDWVYWGTWLFIIGSLGMVIDSVGDAVLKWRHEDHERARQLAHPPNTEQARHPDR